jgi:hypothetical protein
MNTHIEEQKLKEITKQHGGHPSLLCGRALIFSI